MVLSEIIQALDAAIEKDGERAVQWGFDPSSAHSWRGDYSDLSFEPMEGVSLADMRDALRNALGKTFEGYKGGDYTMRDTTYVYIDPYGDCPGNRIGQSLVAYWTGEWAESSW